LLQRALFVKIHANVSLEVIRGWHFL